MKIVSSPVKKFPGTVGIKDPIPLSACVEWEAGLAECQPSPCSEGRRILTQFWRTPNKERDVISSEYEEHFTSCVEKGGKCRSGLTDTAAQARMIKSLKACVEEWHVDGFDLANPPGSPKIARSQFVAWLIGEVSNIYNEAEAAGDPNELRPEPTSS
jgi:hypothetical protein